MPLFLKKGLLSRGGNLDSSLLSEDSLIFALREGPGINEDKIPTKQLVLKTSSGALKNSLQLRKVP